MFLIFLIVVAIVEFICAGGIITLLIMYGGAEPIDYISIVGAIVIGLIMSYAAVLEHRQNHW